MKNRWILFIIISIVGFFLDWYTKYLAYTNLQERVPVDVIGKNLQWLLIYNKGALFGLDPRHWLPWFPVNSFFLVFSVIAIALLIGYYASLTNREKLMHWGLALIMPGALGNMFDRIIRPGQGVVDFIKMGISEDRYWPIYNLADVYVTFGVGLILVSFVLDEMKKKKETATAVANPQQSASEQENADTAAR